MELESFGVKLVKLTNEKKELVRVKRNDPDIQKFMQYREYITEEMQEKWFEKINQSNLNYYFVINYNDTDIGLANLKDIDYENRIAECGIFLWDNQYIHTGISCKAYLCMLDFSFGKLGLSSLLAHILQDNIRSVKFHKKFGFYLSKNQEAHFHQEYMLEKSEYLNRRNIIIENLND